MDGGTESVTPAMREISNHTIVRWIYDHCRDPDTDSKCADLGIAIRSLVLEIESLDRSFGTGQTDSDDHANLRNEDVNYTAATLDFVILLQQCEQLLRNSTKFRYGNANELQDVVWSASIQAKNDLLEKILLQRRRFSNIPRTISSRTDVTRQNSFRRLENKEVSILLASPPEFQDCRLVVIRDLSQPRGTSVHVERQWKQNATLHSTSCIIDVNTDVLKPLYAVTSGLHRHLSIEICDSEGQHRELYEFADLRETFKFQRALTNYNVFSDFENVDWGIPRVFKSSLVCKGSRVQIWWLDPEDNLEELVTTMIAPASRSNGSDSIPSSRTRYSGRDILSESGPRKPTSASLYPAIPSEVAAIYANPRSNALIIAYVMGRNGLEYLCTQRKLFSS